MNVLTVQSSVALGHVGNNAAVPALHAFGHEAWAVSTVTFSNHPAHGGFRGRVTPSTEIVELIEGLRERGAFAACHAVLSGYLGAAEQGPTILDTIAMVRAVNSAALYLLDPVIGEHGPKRSTGRVYVKPGIAEYLRDEMVSMADVMTPNAFELEFLTGRTVRDTPTALAAIEALRQRLSGRARRDGPLVVTTGLILDDQAPGTLAVIGADETGAWRMNHPAIDHPAHGAGDLFAALLLARLLNGEAVSEATAMAGASVYAIVERTAAAASKDLLIITGREALLSPARRFPLIRL
jgi:pyridoxine kinase